MKLDLKGFIKNNAKKVEKLTKEEEAEVKIGGGNFGTRFPLGPYEDVLIKSIEICDKPSRDENFLKVIIHFERDVVFKKEDGSEEVKKCTGNKMFHFPMYSVKWAPGGQPNSRPLWAYEAVKKFLSAVWNTHDITSEVAQYIGQMLANGETELLVGMKVNMNVTFGTSPHPCRVEDPNDPTKKVIKVKYLSKNKDTGKWEEHFVKNGLKDATFTDFKVAEEYSKVKKAEAPTSMWKNYKPFPELDNFSTSLINEVPKEIYEFIDSVNNPSEEKEEEGGCPFEGGEKVDEDEGFFD